MSYHFDFGDDWLHKGVVYILFIDPIKVLGYVPATPLRTESSTEKFTRIATTD